MDGQAFDAAVRNLFRKDAPRRPLLAGLAAGALAVTGLRVPERAADAKRRSRKKPLQRNEFGCVPVGKACQGKDNVCCSGICKGKKPRHGRKDKSRCVAHDATICERGQSSCAGGILLLCTTSVGDQGVCETTTGKAGFCSAELNCRTCRRDRDCQGEFGARAACAVCADCPNGTACVKPDD